MEKFMSIEKMYYRLHQAMSKPEERGEYSSGYWQYLVRQTAQDMCAMQKGRLLEVGCGEGLFLAGLIKAFPGLEIFGVDQWDEALSKSERRLNQLRPGVTLRRADASDLPFEDAFFDKVVCINVFLNMDSIAKVSSSLNEIARVCKKGSRIIFDIRNSLNPFLVVKYKLAKYYDATSRNLNLSTYKPAEIRVILKNAGFEIVRERPLFFPLKPMAPIIMFEGVKK
ncbi:MAG: class I SAM-dependent methyltransferase [Nitrospiraceae bacterium]|nr:MAG: class I SAM-dependent methyltransferase [Nitrospiraceae bacterium]